MQRSRELALQVVEIDPLFKAPDQLHPAIEVEPMHRVDVGRRLGRTGLSPFGACAFAHRTLSSAATTWRPLPPYCRMSERTFAVIRCWATPITSDSLCEPSNLCTSAFGPTERTDDSSPSQKACLRTVPTLNLATPSAIAGATADGGKPVPPWMTSGTSTRSWIDRRRPMSMDAS